MPCISNGLILGQLFSLLDFSMLRGCFHHQTLIAQASERMDTDLSWPPLYGNQELIQFLFKGR